MVDRPRLLKRVTIDTDARVQVRVEAFDALQIRTNDVDRRFATLTDGECGLGRGPVDDQGSPSTGDLP